MGVFSVIQKQKFHHSNIYSGAPMPYMQRITWSGVAMHAGVLPGYPASHGCIRMPMAFAIKMWNWTRMGARVVVAPGEMAPASFSHPLLPTMKVAPQPVAAEEPKTDTPVGAKTDKGAPEPKPANSEAKLELRPTVGHADSAKPAIDAPATAPRDETLTADASSDRAASKTPVTMSDAASVEAREKPAEIKTEAAKLEAKLDEVQGEPKADAARQTEKAADLAMAVTDAGPSASDAKKDQTRLPDTVKPLAARPEPPKHTGQIAVFISRKDSKLYVRQNFAPLFDVPVAIAPSDRPLGTHVFTAEVDKNDANVLHWSVVSLPVSVRNILRNDRDERVSRRRRVAGASTAEAKPLPVADSPSEALDRIAIPADVMARITQALTTSASIIVSDQGINQGETGEGTDFIVSLR
jgi:hypothetical protein